MCETSALFVDPDNRADGDTPDDETRQTLQAGPLPRFLPLAREASHLRLVLRDGRPSHGTSGFTLTKMLELKTADLAADESTIAFVKHETVDVVFAGAGGELVSREGLNRFAAGDALITGSTGDRWSVSRSRFDAKYLPADAQPAGADGPYAARPLPVLARQMDEAFSISRSAGGDLLLGRAGDWLLQYAPGDFGIVEDARFRKVYRPLDESGPAGSTRARATDE
ncbi:MAG: PGDYG domain-containing protein [Sulfuritalea sp.]|nr:PGDYG domain-containing protein [Sulfuritalea sp.]